MKRLDRIVEDIRRCRLCIEAPEGIALPHDPRPVLQVSTTAKICVCGQAPGSKVHASGRPFTDPSGVRLRSWMGVSEQEFYDVSKVAIVPMGFCFPGLNDKGGDLPPRRECAKAWHSDLFSILPNFSLIVVVGSYAQKWHLKQKAEKTLTETVSAWRTYGVDSSEETTRYFPTPHPSWRNNAWLKKNPWFLKDAVPALQRTVRDLLR